VEKRKIQTRLQLKSPELSAEFANNKGKHETLDTLDAKATAYGPAKLLYIVSLPLMTSSVACAPTMPKDWPIWSGAC
jgi:hypothetical protein